MRLKRSQVCMLYRVIIEVIIFFFRFNQVYKLEKTHKYPSMIWDLLPHAGASQVHPHVHGFIDKDAYQG